MQPPFLLCKTHPMSETIPMSLSPIKPFRGELVHVASLEKTDDDIKTLEAFTDCVQVSLCFSFICLNIVCCVNRKLLVLMTYLN